MYFPVALYIICAAFLIIYSSFICPFLSCIDIKSLLWPIIVPVAAAIPIRFIAGSVLKKRIVEEIKKRSHLIFRISNYEFFLDFIIWTIIGISLIFFLDSSSVFGIKYKLLLGCISFGILGGILNHLLAEKFIISNAIVYHIEFDDFANIIRPFSYKLLRLLILTILTISSVVILMLYLNIKTVSSVSIGYIQDYFHNFFYEIGYGLSILVIMTILVIRLFADNIKLVMNTQIGAMDAIVSGKLEERIPVLTDDEFGLMAIRANQMVKGLREKDVCQRRFGLYMTPEVSQLILQSSINLEGESVEATIMFCDLRGYTQLAEKRTPKEVVSFLNEYFSAMEQAIKAAGGILLQYIGDEIEAVFGAPSRLEQHAQRALDCALDMRKRLMELNHKRRMRGEEEVQHGIGIHTGKVLAGSIGSPTRKVYAMVGDAVNLASRLQELNKEYGTDIIISETTRSLLENHYALKDLGEVAVKGRSSRVRIFQVL